MGNLRNLLLVLVNLPFALVGGVLAALLSGWNLSLGSLVGFVTLFGITLRNSIMLISHYEHFDARGRHDLEPGDCDFRRFGAIGDDLDDGVGYRLGLLPLAIGRRRPRPRNRGTHGNGGSRRTCYFNGSQPSRSPNVLV